MSLKNPSDFFEQQKKDLLKKEVAQKKVEEDAKIKNKKFAAPKDFFGEDEEVVAEIIKEEEVREETQSNPPEVKSYDEEIKRLQEKVDSVTRSIPTVKDLIKLRKEEKVEVRSYDEEIKGLNTEVKELLYRIASLKIPDQEKYLEEVNTLSDDNQKLLTKIEGLQYNLNEVDKNITTEGLLNIIPSAKNSDPLTPLDQKFVTLQDLSDHYRIFVNRVQQQLSVLGGGGAVRIEDLEDVDISSAMVDGKVLEYDSSTGKWKGGTGGGGSVGLGTTNVSTSTLNVVGLSTFVGAINANGNLDVDGHTELDDVNVSGAITATTFTGNLAGTINTAAQSNITSLGTLTGLDVNGHSELDNLNVSGVSTFIGNVTIGGTLTYEDVTNIDSLGIITARSDIRGGRNLNVTGLSTFTGAIDANGNLDVDGHTELDDVNITGYSTVTNLKISGTIKDNLDTAGDSGQVLTTTGVGVTWSNVGDLAAGSASKVVLSAQNTTDASRFVPFADAATGANIIYTDTGFRYNPSTNTLTATTFSGALSGNATSATTLETARNIGGVSFDGSANINLPGVNASGNQDTSGNAATATTLETARNIGGVSFNGGSNIDLPGVNTSGNQNTTGTSGGLTGTPSITVQDITAEMVSVAGTLTAADITNIDSVGFATIRKGLNVQGTGSTTTTLNVTGVSTFAGIGTFGGDVFIDGNVRIVGVLTVGSDSVTIDGNNLNITGVSTIASLAVSAGATAKDLNVTGITTLTTLKIGNSIGITTILDEDNLSSDSASALASQQSIKAYVDAQVTAQDLDFSGDSGTGAVDLDSQTFSVSGTSSEIETSASGQAITVGLPDNVIVGSALTVTNNFKIGGSATVGINTILDEDSFASNSATALVTQQSIKAYVDSNLTAQDLDFTGGTGNGSVDLDSQSFTISGTNNEIETTASGTTLTIGLPDNVNVAGNLSVAGNISGSMSQTVFSGVTTVSNVTEAANATTAALVVSGGIGVAKNIVVGGGLTVTGDVSIGGTLTYEDVTNIDSVGFVTARTGLRVTDGGIVVTAGVSTVPSVIVGSGVTINSTGIFAAAGIVTASSLAVSAGATAKDLKVTGVSTLSSAVVGTAVTINSTGIIASGIITASSFDGTLATSNLTGTVSNAQLGGSIANDKLANSTVSFGGIEVALGAADATPAFDLADATNYPTSSLSGTITNAQLAGSIANAKLSNSTVSYGGIEVALGAADATPAFNLTDATNYPYNSLTGITTNIIGDTTPQLGGNLDFNSKYITGTGGINLTGIITATSSYVGTAVTTNSTGIIASGIITATTFSGSGASLNSIPNSALDNSYVSYGGISLSLGGTDATPAFNLTDAVNYKTTNLVGTITNAQLAGSITNSKLSNDSVSFGGVEIDLGNSDNTPAFNLSDATDYPTSSLTGTITNAQLAGSISQDKLAGSIANGKLANSNVQYGGIALSLGESDSTPAFNLSDATNYPYASLTGITTNILGDTTPQLGGNLDINGKYITGTGGANITGVVTATTFKGNLTGDVTGDVTAASVVVGSAVTANASGLNVTGLSTFVGVGTFSTDVYIGGDLTIDGDLSFDEFTATNADITGIATVATLGVSVATTSKDLKVTGVSTLSSAIVGTAVTINSSGINASGIITATTFKGNLTGDVTGDLTGNADTATLATNAQGLTGTPSIIVGAITAASATYSGNVTIGGTLTYEDVTNVDAIGFITTRKGINVTAGITTTPTLHVGAGIITASASGVNVTGVITATTFDGNLATTNLTGTITNAQLAGSISNDKLAGSITNDKLAGSIANDKLANSSVNYGGITLSLGGSDTTPAFDLSDATNYPTSSLSGTITNAQLAGSIANAKLSNSSVSYGGVELALGATDATPAFNLQDATAYPYGSLTGITTSIVGDSTPKLGGDLDTNNNDIITSSNRNLNLLPNGSGKVIIDGNGSSGGVLIHDGNIDIKTGTGSVSKIKFYCEVSNAHAQTLQAQPHSASSSSTLTLPIATGTLIGTGDSGTVTNTMLAGSIANSKLSNSTVSYGGVSLALGASDASPAFDLSDATNYPTSSLSGTITNAQLAGSIANSKLSNSTVSYGGISLALGATDATPAFDLQDATGYPTSSLVGTITNAQLAGSIANAKLSNSTVSFGGVELALGASDSTPAFNLQDATAYPYGSLTGIQTHILGDTTPQLGGNLDFNSKYITGTGGINLTGIVTATEAIVGTAVTINSGGINAIGISTLSSVVVGAAVTINSTGIDAVAGVVTAYALDAAIIEWTLGASGSSHYTFTGPGDLSNANDPALNLVRGQKYIFKNRSGGHPFRIQTSYQNTSGTAYNDGVTNNSAGNGTDLIFDVPYDAPNILYYQCTAHSGMSGYLYIGNSWSDLSITGVSTFTGAIDANGGANIAGGLVANSAQVSDLTSGRVTYAGGSGELQDSGNLTFSGSELTASSATVSDLTDNRVVIAGSSGALEDSSNLTFDGSTLTVNGDVSVAGTITYQEVSEIDAVGFVTARKGVRVTNGGIIVTAGLSTFSDDVKFAGANYDITYDRSADSIIWNDNAKGIFGTGSDLQLYHNGTNSKIYNATGRLDIEGDDIQFWNKAGNEELMTLAANGAVTLYHNDSAKFATSSTGGTITGTLVADGFTGPLTGNVTGNCTGSSGSCTGTANLATNATISANNSANETVYPTFVDGATGTQGLETDSGLTYNPSTGVLTSTNFTGAVTGNVTGNCTGSSGSCTGNAATADAVDVSSISTNAAYYAVFTDNNGSGKTLGVDAGLTYNPSTNVLTASGGVTADLTGDVTGNVTGNCTGSSGSCTGNAASSDTIDTTSTNNNATNYLAFVDSSGTQSGETLRTYTNLTCNPNSGTITATEFVGGGAGLTGLAGGGGEFNTGISEYGNYTLTTSMATAFTANSSTSHRTIVHSCRVTNYSASEVTVSGELYGSSKFAHLIPVPAGSSVELLKKPKVLGASDTIELQASSGSALSAAIACERQENTDLVASSLESTDTSVNTLATMGAAAVVESILCVNDDGTNDVKATVTWTNSSGTVQSYLSYEMVIPAGATVEILERPLAMPNGHKIRVTANIANRLCTISAHKVAS